MVPLLPVQDFFLEPVPEEEGNAGHDSVADYLGPYKAVHAEEDVHEKEKGDVEDQLADDGQPEAGPVLAHALEGEEHVEAEVPFVPGTSGTNKMTRKGSLKFFASFAFRFYKYFIRGITAQGIRCMQLNTPLPI